MKTWIRKCPLPLRWAGSMAILGAVVAYQPAISQSNGFSLPYAGDATAVDSPVVTFANDATTGADSDGLFASTASADPGSVGLYATSQGGTGVYGYANGSATTAGVYGFGDGNSGYGVYGEATTNFGVYGKTDGSNGSSVTASGVFGTGSSSTAVGVMGSVTSSNQAILGMNGGSGQGVWGQSANDCGVYGIGNGVGPGVYGTNTAGGAGVIGVDNSSVSPAGYFLNNNTYINAIGMEGQCAAGWGVFGYGRVGVFGIASANNGFSGYFQGNVQVTGTLSAAAKNFKIDHPLDPAHKYLVHSCIESDQQLNLYTGDATLDSDGRATVQMPDWFEAENTRFHYQLTAIGEAAPSLYVAQKMRANHFEIAGGKPGMEVSWQVTGTRQDAYARAHPLVVEPEKTGSDRGKYLYPEENGRPAEEGIRQLPASVPTPAHSLKAVTMPKPVKLTPRKAKVHHPLR